MEEEEPWEFEELMDDLWGKKKMTENGIYDRGAADGSTRLKILQKRWGVSTEVINHTVDIIEARKLKMGSRQSEAMKRQY